MAEEKSRKELLEEPDPFMVFVGKALAFYRKYQQQVIVGVGAVVLVAIVVTGIIYYQGKEEERAAAMLGQANAKYQAMRQKGPSFMDHEALKNEFRTISEKHAKTGAGRAALLQYADLAYATGDYDTAVSAYGKALDAYKDQPEFKNLIYNGLAYAYEGKKDLEKAQAHYEMIVSGAQTGLKDQALFNLARIYEKKGMEKEKAEAYQRIVSDYPEFMYYELARENTAG